MFYVIYRCIYEREWEDCQDNDDEKIKQGNIVFISPQLAESAFDEVVFVLASQGVCIDITLIIIIIVAVIIDDATIILFIVISI